MSYSPILNPSFYDSVGEVRRCGAVKAAAYLQELAKDKEKFRSALEDPAFYANQVCTPEVAPHLIEQLQVIRYFFAEGFDKYFDNVSRMLLDVRVELFAGKSAKP